ncbi:UNVERIFIED_CONTAM: membrane-associated HD superfamily phosphohydrolase [Brevibacillus sp. OAP136]
MIEQFLNYWAKPLPKMEFTSLKARLSGNQTMTLVIIALLSTFAALFQLAGGFMPGPGYLISPLSTAPIVVVTLLSLRSGVTAYVLAIMLILLIQPSELTVFPFTTGVLGLALGFGIVHFKSRIQIVLFSAVALWAGIAMVLYGLHFPLLGPLVADTFHIDMIMYIFLFCLFYSGIWTEISLRLLRILRTHVNG